MKYSRKGHKDRNRHKNRLKWNGQARLAYVKNINGTIPASEGEPMGTSVWVWTALLVMRGQRMYRLSGCEQNWSLGVTLRSMDVIKRSMLVAELKAVN